VIDGLVFIALLACIGAAAALLGRVAFCFPRLVAFIDRTLEE
jgi:hypothetical protein